MEVNNESKIEIVQFMVKRVFSTDRSKTTYQKSISWMTMSEIETMDLNTTVDTASAEQETNTFEGLLCGKVKPGIAKTSAAGAGQG